MDSYQIILLTVAAYLVFIATMVRVPDTLPNKFALKFIPLVLSIILVLATFKLI